MGDKMEGVVPTGRSGGLIDPDKYPMPIETIYVNNLDERCKIDKMKEILRGIFSYVGPIVDIVAKSSVKRKGQAFIVFDRDNSNIEKAFLMDGFTFYGKAMRVQMARTHSDATVQRKAPEMFEDHKRRRLTVKDFKRAAEDAKAQANPVVPTSEKPRGPVIPDEYVRPSKTLFLQSLPKDVSTDSLTEYFEQFAGFSEARYVPQRDVAFVDFESDEAAIMVKDACANLVMGAEQKPIKVTYARKQ